jgi:hypothetical protein
MKGRSRGYTVGAPSAKSVLSLAFNNRCDVILATVVAGDEPVAQGQAVLEFPNGDLVLPWDEAILGLYSSPPATANGVGRRTQGAEADIQLCKMLVA